MIVHVDSVCASVRACAFFVRVLFLGVAHEHAHSICFSPCNPNKIKKMEHKRGIVALHINENTNSSVVAKWQNGPSHSKSRSLSFAKRHWWRPGSVGDGSLGLSGCQGRRME